MDFEGEFLFNAQARAYPPRIFAANSRETHG
jgi:hypothetical protein